jgi:hypothetical protein
MLRCAQHDMAQGDRAGADDAHSHIAPGTTAVFGKIELSLTCWSEAASLPVKRLNPSGRRSARLLIREMLPLCYCADG